MNVPILNLNDFFSEMSPSERWTIVEPLLAKDGRHGVAMAIDEPPGKVMTIGKLHWSLSTGTSFSTTL